MANSAVKMLQILEELDELTHKHAGTEWLWGIKEKIAPGQKGPGRDEIRTRLVDALYNGALSHSLGGYPIRFKQVCLLCEFGRFAGTREEAPHAFWPELWGLLQSHNIDTLQIQERIAKAIDKALGCAAYDSDGFLQDIAKQLDSRPDQP